MPIPKKAKHCNECKSFQDWRRILLFYSLPIGFLAALFPVLSGGFSGLAYLHDRNSDTKLKVTTSDDARIYVMVWNTGRKPSTLVSYRLIFDQMPRREFLFELSDKDQPVTANVIVPGNPIKIGLSLVAAESIPTSAQGRQYTDQNRRDLLHSNWTERPLTLEIDVEESDDPCTFCFSPRLHHTRSDHFPANRIEKFLRGSMGG
jgi:hypothetical protein